VDVGTGVWDATVAVGAGLACADKTGVGIGAVRSMLRTAGAGAGASVATASVTGAAAGGVWTCVTARALAAGSGPKTTGGTSGKGTAARTASCEGNRTICKSSAVNRRSLQGKSKPGNPSPWPSNVKLSMSAWTSNETTKAMVTGLLFRSGCTDVLTGELFKLQIPVHGRQPKRCSLFSCSRPSPWGRCRRSAAYCRIYRPSRAKCMQC
jgi:hypothetical protein